MTRQKICRTTNSSSIPHAGVAGGSLGLLSTIGVCGGICSSAAIPLSAALASIGLGGLSNWLVNLRIPLLLMALVFGFLGIRGLIQRRNALGSAIFGLFLGGATVSSCHTAFFPDKSVRSMPLAELGQDELGAIRWPYDLEEFRTSFNADQDKIRFVTLLSPRCPGCVKGYEKVKQLFETNKSDKLVGHVVWLPMVKGDSFAAAETHASAWSDPRVKNYWDKERRIGIAFTGALGLNRTAWDIYVGYEPGAYWEEHRAPPTPEFWMHQLWGLQKDNFLDGAKLIKSIGQLTKGAM